MHFFGVNSTIGFIIKMYTTTTANFRCQGGTELALLLYGL